MEPISKSNAINLLNNSHISLFTIADAKKIFAVEKDNTLYILLQRLEKSGIIKRMSKGKYRFFLKEVNDFSLANFLVTPSYISLESALSFYGILPQFPYSITSITIRKTKKIISETKEFEFAHLDKRHFFSFIKKDSFFIATPEKALLDQLYFMSKKIRSIHLDDLDLTAINTTILKQLSEVYSFLPLQNLLKTLHLC